MLMPLHSYGKLTKLGNGITYMEIGKVREYERMDAGGRIMQEQHSGVSRSGSLDFIEQWGK